MLRLTCLATANDKPAEAGLGSKVVRLDVVADAQAFDENAVLLDVAVLDVLQQTAALTDEHHEATASVVVLLVNLQMLGEVADALGKNCHLHLGAAGVVLVFAILFDELCYALFGNAVPVGHDFHLSFSAPLGGHCLFPSG